MGCTRETSWTLQLKSSISACAAVCFIFKLIPFSGFMGNQKEFDIYMRSKFLVNSPFVFGTCASRNFLQSDSLAALAGLSEQIRSL